MDENPYTSPLHRDPSEPPQRAWRSVHRILVALAVVAALVGIVALIDLAILKWITSR